MSGGGSRIRKSLQASTVQEVAILNSKNSNEKVFRFLICRMLANPNSSRFSSKSKWILLRQRSILLDFIHASFDPLGSSILWDKLDLSFLKLSQSSKRYSICLAIALVKRTARVMVPINNAILWRDLYLSLTTFNGLFSYLTHIIQSELMTSLYFLFPWILRHRDYGPSILVQNQFLKNTRKHLPISGLKNMQFNCIIIHKCIL